MSGPAPAVAAIRLAVRTLLGQRTNSDQTARGTTALVACSGGADSLALAAAAAFVGPRMGRQIGAVLVDHGLQNGSAQVTATGARTCADLGLHPVCTVRVELRHSGAGLEADARTARYEAFARAAHDHNANTILLGHTLDDQAEQVLLGLMRGSGARSLAGMARQRGLFARPFLDVPGSTTRAACAALGLTPWRDPHNDDERFARVRARQLLAQAEDELGPGIAAALARSAAMLRLDADALDRQAQRIGADLGAGPWPVALLSDLEPAVRRRVWRILADQAGVRPGAVTHRHVEAIESLLCDWHGQGPVYLPGAATARRVAGAIRIDAPDFNVGPTPNPGHASG